jgi:hypothetical protein
LPFEGPGVFSTDYYSVGDYMSEEAAEAEVVKPLAMILFESIAYEPLARKTHFMGILGALMVPEVPFRLTFTAVAMFSEIREPIRGFFRLCDSEGTIQDTQVQEIDEPPDHMAERSLTISFVNREFAHYGNFYVELWINDKYIMDRRLIILEPPHSAEENEA